ncbi:MAG: hypothetical protein HKN04_06020 [Rhodothermaceae bacterium]|nr:hypothetical protein [Rhodothermaceae bacterium]
MSNSPAPRPFNAVALFASLGAALVAIMLLAILTPRWSVDESTNWIVTIGGGLVAAVLAYAFLATRGKEQKKTVEPPH